ncbi:hypothetical protein R3Q06_32475 [Rhodococcus erythropolis]|uniref:AAA family ATPase n=1 Tax=Rhodococcus erythropolis TaxID=1833 RepID=UPI00294A7E01|nr:AAA family ATPase [Rhodococcus erythropolis]MDV6278182.1 hypothetical protein [Rhodococcus erythropolis]
MNIVEMYLAEQTDIAVGRQFLALATAGPPAAGKSSSVERRALAGQGWRVLDADRVKDHLLRDALEQGFYDDLLDIELADGHRLMPRELATLVHTESTIILDAIAERCLAIGENVVMEGTFSWPGLGRRLLSELAEADYQKLTILDVEAPLDTTRARALNRWRRGRETALRGGDPLGGRFTPAFVIDALYTADSVLTVCAHNARATFEDPLAAEIPTVELFVENVDGADETWVKENGVVVYPHSLTQ